MNEFKEYNRDSRYKLRQEVDHIKRTFATKDLRISGDVVYKALMVPDFSNKYDTSHFKNPPNNN